MAYDASFIVELLYCDV